ncbi:TetR/AcrR family transcriptional regulator [Micromonospora sp. NPDC049559]|uniref:TetR/AcrR family transcriptional regulator n=1 Tax=Micromonospora sp. NPDC049559 TaxID=3155923 RepID=UPI003423136D
MTDAVKPPSARREELLELAYAYVLTHGLAEMSLRPLATAIGSSPRVLLLLFDSKDGLVRALLGRARAEELELLARLRLRTADPAVAGTGAAVAELWRWMAAPEHRGLLLLWAEAYAHSLVVPRGAWADFAQATVRDWLDVLTAGESASAERADDRRARATLTLAVLRGALLDLLATGDVARTTAAVRRYVDGLPG